MNFPAQNQTDFFPERGVAMNLISLYNRDVQARILRVDNLWITFVSLKIDLFSKRYLC